MRSIWTGAITFGLVNVPIKVCSATQDHDVGLHQVHDADGGRIRYERRCEVCGKVIEYAHIDKAYADGGTTVVLTSDDLKTLPVERSREIEVVEFVPSDQIDPLRFDRSYFLEPDANAAKAYALLLATLEETDRTAVVHFSLRQKTRLGALRARDGVLVLQSLLWDDEVREADFDGLKDAPKVSAAEKKMAASLVENMSTDFEPSKFTDDYAEQLRTLIAAKLEQGDAVDTAATFGEEGESPDSAEVIDLVEALRRSVEANREKRSGSGSGSASARAATKATEKKTAGSTNAPAKKATATKSAAKKTSANKATAKKTAAKKTAARKTGAEGQSRKSA